jgi:hypothetical protein
MLGEAMCWWMITGRDRRNPGLMCILCSQGCWTALPENRGFEAFGKGKPGQDNRLYWKMKKRVRSLESVPKKVIYRLERLEFTGRGPVF